MNSGAAFGRAVAVGRALTRALLLASALTGTLSCANDDDSHSPMGPGSGASSAGEAGSADTAAGETGMGGSGTIAGSAGAAGAVHGVKPCFSDADCNDGLYCNGIELCRSVFPGSDVMVCMGTEHGPCWPSPCSESSLCDCSHPDQDRDGYRVEGCSDGKDFDCDDTDGQRNPARSEVCDANQYDEDCDDRTFAGLGMDKHGHRDGDTDGDGYFAESCANRAKYQPLFSRSQKPLTIGGTDCDDSKPLVHPGAAEVCDTFDNNCNGEIDEVSGDQGDPHTYYRDQDGDYWGSDENPRDTLCNFPPPGYSLLHGDCNDSDPRISPVREEICNGIDDDCNGTIDEPEKPGDLLFAQPYDGVTQFECKGDEGWSVEQCPAGRLDCNGKYVDACETIGSTRCNCHKCGRTCAFSCGEADCEEIALLSTGYRHTCALIATPGSAAGGSVACWGQNFYAQLGNGSSKDSSRAMPVADLTNVTAIATGERHSCAISDGGRLSCWGDNGFGQLGSGPKEHPVTYPAPISLTPFLQSAMRVVAGSFHTCAIFDEGRVACWGRGDLGQLGNNDTINVDSPARVTRLDNGTLKFIDDATQVVAGYQHTCSISAGRVECWGDNSNQQLGFDPATLDAAKTARPVPGLEGVHIDELSASAFHTCARSEGRVYCWGSNYDHELALKSGDYGPPTEITLPASAVAIATGSYFGCALGSNRVVYCWGSNDSGELGSLYDPTSVQPNPIALEGVTGIFGGLGAHVCAVTSSKETWCWGSNELGELGNGTTSSLPQPVPSRITPLSDDQTCGSP